MRRSRQGVLLLMTSCSLDCFSQAGSDFKIRQGLIGWQANEHPGHIYGSGPERKKHPEPATEPISSHTPDYSLSTYFTTWTRERAVRERSEISNRQGELWSGELESRWFYSQAVLLLLPPWKSVNHPLLSPPRSKPLPVLGALLISEPASAATAAPATPHLLLHGLPLLCGFWHWKPIH